MCEIRRMNLQGLLDRVVSDHRPSLATLRYDIERAIPKVAEKWKPWFDDPRDIHGSAFCTDVRLILLRMRELRGPMRGDTLLTSCGSGLSVQVSDCRGMDFRVRRWPAKKLHGERVRAVVSPIAAEQPVSRVPAAVGEQMILDEGQQEQLFPAAMATPAGKYEVFSLWWPTADGMGLSEAVLAAVVDVDNASRVQILATSALPPVTDSPLLAASAMRTAVPGDDFGEYTPPVVGSGTDDDPDEPA
ncbi:MAG TPA: hypothetical protein VLZ05_30230 [Mycobacterium sp.]|nr:hypothetical protein [Mycobacterium sp.]